MKFGERLTELRKKEGLSQEELGYKLNVTRQTVSKWELGQTTPEMDKLVELSKIFNTSVDELISETETISNENEVIQDGPVKEKKSNSSTKAIIIIIAIVVIFVAIVIYILTTPFRMLDKATEDLDGTAGSIFDKAFGIIDTVTNEFEDSENESEKIQNKFWGIFDKASNMIDENMDSMNQKNEEFEQQKELAENMIEEIKNEIAEEDEKIDSIKGQILQSIMSQGEQQKAMQVFIEPDATDEEIEELGNKIRGIQYVNSIELITKEDALNEVKSWLKDSQHILDSFSEQNPFKASYVINLTDLTKREEVEREISTFENVENVY